MIGVPNKVPESRRTSELHRLLCGIFSTDTNKEEKIEIAQEYGILDDNFERRITEMCNLSEGIEEKGIKIGIERGRAEGIEKGIEKGREETIKGLLKLGKLSNDDIAISTGASLDAVNRIAEKLNLSQKSNLNTDKMSSF